MLVRGVTVIGTATSWCAAGGCSAGPERLAPGLAVGGCEVPGEEALEFRPGWRLAAVASAGVQVGGEVGEDVQPGHLGGAGDGPDPGGEPGGRVVAGAAGVLAGDDGPADRPLGDIVILIRMSE